MSSKNFNSFKDFQSDQIQTSSHKLFTAHYACSSSELNLTPVTGTTNGFIFQIISSLIESWGGVRLTCFDCNEVDQLTAAFTEIFVVLNRHSFPVTPETRIKIVKAFLIKRLSKWLFA